MTPASPPRRRRIILVSGAPGAGKTSLAVPLAARLCVPLFSKDIIKERLTESLGDAGGDLTASRLLGGATMELIWTLAAYAPVAMLEANFRPHSDYERAKLASLDADLLELHCDCGIDETARRFRERARSSAHHAAHPLRELSPELLAEYDRPVGIGHVIPVDTNQPIEIEPLAASIEAHWLHLDGAAARLR